MTYAELHDVVLQHGRTIYSFCLYLTRSTADADDLYQETFLKAAALCPKIDATQNPKAFLIRVAAGLWKNQQRKERRRQKILPLFSLEAENADIPAAEPLPECGLIQQEEARLLVAAAARLPQKLRLPLYLYYTAELSLKEIAAILHLPVGTVKSRLWRAKKELKHILEVHGYEA